MPEKTVFVSMDYITNNWCLLPRGYGTEIPIHLWDQYMDAMYDLEKVNDAIIDYFHEQQNDYFHEHQKMNSCSDIEVSE